MHAAVSPRVISIGVKPTSALGLETDIPTHDMALSQSPQKSMSDLNAGAPLSAVPLINFPVDEAYHDHRSPISDCSSRVSLPPE